MEKENRFKLPVCTKCLLTCGYQGGPFIGLLILPSRTRFLSLLFNKENVAVMASGDMQWVKGKKWPFECILVANGNYKELTIGGKMISIRELLGIS